MSSLLERLQEIYEEEISGNGLVGGACKPGVAKTYKEYVKMCGGVPKSGEWSKYQEDTRLFKEKRKVQAKKRKEKKQAEGEMSDYLKILMDDEKDVKEKPKKPEIPEKYRTVGQRQSLPVYDASPLVSKIKEKSKTVKYLQNLLKVRTNDLEECNRALQKALISSRVESQQVEQVPVESKEPETEVTLTASGLKKRKVQKKKLLKGKSLIGGEMEEYVTMCKKTKNPQLLKLLYDNLGMPSMSVSESVSDMPSKPSKPAKKWAVVESKPVVTVGDAKDIKPISTKQRSQEATQLIQSSMFGDKEKIKETIRELEGRIREAEEIGSNPVVMGVLESNLKKNLKKLAEIEKAEEKIEGQGFRDSNMKRKKRVACKKENKKLSYKDYVKSCGGIPPKGQYKKYLSGKEISGKGISGGCCMACSGYGLVGGCGCCGRRCPYDYDY